MNKNEITIKGKNYFVEFFKDNRSYVGESDITNNIIKVDKTLNNLDLQKCIFHELLHVYFYECGLIEFSENELLITFLDSIYFDLLASIENILNFFKEAK